MKEKNLFALGEFFHGWKMVLKEEKRNIFSERKYSIHTETIREWRTWHDIAGV